MFNKYGIYLTRFFVGCGMVVLWLGCASSSQHTLSSNQIEPSTNKSEPAKPVSQISSSTPNNTFAYQLPFGIGGRFDMMMYETVDTVSDFYDSYVKPMRNKKFLYNTMNYSILPSSGDLYRLDNELHDKTIKSDYDFRVGMTRRFSKFSDFWKTDFWLANDHYGPETPPPQVENTDPFGMPPLFGNGNHGYVESEYIDFDLDEQLSKRWNFEPKPTNEKNDGHQNGEQWLSAVE